MTVLSVEKHETINPRLIFRVPTPDQEFGYLWSILKDTPFFKTHNYNFVIPDHPDFQKLTQSADFNNLDEGKYRKLFEAEIYDEDFYKSGLTALEKERLIIESLFPRLAIFSKKWGCNVLPRYEVVLTRYGPGGRYNPDTGSIIALTNIDGSFRRARPCLTVGHEIIEIGIHPLVKKFRLTHEEKERVADHVCIKGLADILEGYTFQTDDPNISPVGDKRIDQFFTQESLDNLPIILKRCVEQYPRE